ncbi:hypothetical protein ABJI51_34305 [Amycolatopsis sp. NEAU-NG30]|uniref:Uncharacterized protein n=1 Tax=Amycolatopsis melonis TaxID=3156488 RepID=A0ABV0LPE5_9PSEU
MNAVAQGCAGVAVLVHLLAFSRPRGSGLGDAVAQTVLNDSFRSSEVLNESFKTLR